jgi:hypothetical protein
VYPDKATAGAFNLSRLRQHPRTTHFFCSGGVSSRR